MNQVVFSIDKNKEGPYELSLKVFLVLLWYFPWW